MSGSKNALLDVDSVPTIASSGAPQVANPLAAITAGNQAASSMYDLRAKQANESLGDAYRQAVDPATGRFDPLKFNQITAGNPSTSLAAGKGIESSQTLQGQQFDLGAAERKAVHSAVTAALESDDANLKQSVLEQVNRLRGQIPNDRLDGTLLHLSSDPAQLRRQLETIRIGNMPTGEAQGAIYGTRQVINTPQGTYAPVLPPASKGGTPVITHSLSPAEAASAVDLKLSDGTVIQVPLAQRNDILNRNPALRALNPDVAPSPSGGPWPPGGRPPPQGGQGGQGQGGGGDTTQPAPPPGVTAPVSPAPTQPPPVPPPQFQTSAARADAAAVRPPPQAGTTPPPAYVDQQKTGGANASRMEGEAQVARTQLQPLLQSMLPELEATGNTGAGQKTLSFLQQLAIRSNMAPERFNPANQQASSEALGKAMTRYQGAQLSALGTSPSDSRQSLAEGMSPSMGYSREGNRKIVHSLMGNNDALDTMYTAWMGSQTRRNNPGGFDQWREAFTKPVADGELKGARFDPTVFAVNRMPPPEQKKYLQDLQKASPNDFNQFKRNWALGLHEGWVKPLFGETTTGRQ
jgi:hypothetical protein